MLGTLLYTVFRFEVDYVLELMLFLSGFFSNQFFELWNEVDSWF